MNAEAAAVVSASVVALVQIVKWAGLRDRWGPLAVMVIAALGVGLWAFANEPTFDRSLVWGYFAAWIVVATSAAGVYGLSRGTAATVTTFRRAPTPTEEPPTPSGPTGAGAAGSPIAPTRGG